MILEADCIEAMRQMDEASVDAIVTDPPYGLEFMGKEWDSIGSHIGNPGLNDRENFRPTKSEFKAGVGTKMGAPKRNPWCRRCGKYKHAPHASKCHCKEPSWNTRQDEGGRQMQGWHQAWAAEALRVLKPGGHLLAAGGTRTFHRLVCALEDAGFEIRDCIAHMYGSGFPKSLNLDRERCACEPSSTGTLGDSRDDYLPRSRSDDGQPHPDAEDDQAPAPSLDDAPERSRGGQLQDGRGAGRANSDPDAETVLPSSADSQDPASASGGFRSLGSRPSDTSSSTSPDESTAGHRTEPRIPDTSRLDSGSPLRNGNLSRCPDCNGLRIPAGLGTALKPAFEPWTLARKPLIGTVVQNVLEHGTGAINVDGCRIATEDNLDGGGYGGELRDPYPTSYGLKRGIGEFEQPAGRWPANVALSHLPECERVGTRRAQGNGRENKGSGMGYHQGDAERGAWGDLGTEQVEAWRCAEGCPVAELDRQSGERPSGAGDKNTANRDNGQTIGHGLGAGSGDGIGGDTGGASRFFYVAKASRAERNAGLDGFEERPVTEDDKWAAKDRRTGTARNPTEWQNRTRNNHPTVKPIALMRWLVRLVTPPNGTILDPFTGSGTTGIAATLEGFDFIGIEREAEYVEIARARLAWWAEHPEGMELVKRLEAEAERKAIADSGQLGLL